MKAIIINKRREVVPARPTPFSGIIDGWEFALGEKGRARHQVRFPFARSFPYEGNGAPTGEFALAPVGRKDWQGNDQYVVVAPDHPEARITEGLLVFWEIVPDNRESAKWRIEGDARLITKGRVALGDAGRCGGGDVPVVHVTGPCRLIWWEGRRTGEMEARFDGQDWLVGRPDKLVSIEEYLASMSPGQRREFARRESVMSDTLLWRLADDESPGVRAGLLWRKGLPADLIEKLAGDPEPEVRRTLVERCALTAEKMGVLAGDPDPDVRWAIAQRGDLPPELVEALAGDDEWQVRRAIAERQDLPAPLVETLAGDDEWQVRRAVAERQDLPAPLVETLAGDDEWPVRRAIAERRDLPVELIKKLAGDDERRVRLAVAQRKGLPAEVSDLLRNDKNMEVRYAIGDR